MLDSEISVKTDSFDGPLSLLLFLIQREEMDIRNLDLTLITKQYLEYLAKMQELNFDVAGEYLYMAATLLALKSKDCIQEEVKGEDDDLESGEGKITSEAELIFRLEELKRFQSLGEKILDLPQLGKEIFVKPKINRKAIIDSILSPMDLNKLTGSMIDLIQRNHRKYKVVKRDRLSIKEKLDFLKNYLKNGQKTNLGELLQAEKEENVTNTIITFISLLELARLKKVRIFQNEDDSEIYVNVIDNLDNFDVNQADGFDDEGGKDQNESLPNDPENGKIDEHTT